MLKSILFSIAILITVHPVLSQNVPLGIVFDDAAFEKAIPAKADITRRMKTRSKSATIKPFMPAVLHQKSYATCGAISFSMAFTAQEARQKDLKNPQDIQKLLYSYGYIYNHAKYPEDVNCNRGLRMDHLLTAIKEHGLIRFASIPDHCIEAKTVATFNSTAFKSGLPTLTRLNLSKGEIKEAIREGNPVVIAMKGTILGASFSTLKTDSWVPESNSPATMGHCMVVVSYDDNKYGGAFEIMNSYGTNWGSKGYAWIRYDDLIKYTHYAVEVPPLTELPPTVLSGQKIKVEPKTLGGTLKLIDNQGRDIKVVDVKGINDSSQVRTMGTRAKTKKSHYIAEKPVHKDFEYQILVDNNEAAYIYVLNFDAQDSLNILFPHKETINAYLGTQNGITLPSANDVIYFDGHKGTEYGAVLFSRYPLDLKNLKRQVETEKGIFLDRLERVLGDKLATAQDGQVKYGLGEGELILETKTEKSVVALIIEFDHR